MVPYEDSPDLFQFVVKYIWDCDSSEVEWYISTKNPLFQIILQYYQHIML